MLLKMTKFKVSSYGLHLLRLPCKMRNREVNYANSSDKTRTDCHSCGYSEALPDRQRRSPGLAGRWRNNKSRSGNGQPAAIIARAGTGGKTDRTVIIGT